MVHIYLSKYSINEEQKESLTIKAHKFESQKISQGPPHLRPTLKSCAKNYFLWTETALKEFENQSKITSQT